MSHPNKSLTAGRAGIAAVAEVRSSPMRHVAPCFLLIGVMFCCVFLSSLRVMALGFQVEGVITRTVYRGDNRGTVQSTDKADFMVCISNRQWFLSTTQNGGGYVFEAGCDGQDAYYIIYDAEQKLQPGMKELIRPGVVTTGLFPEFANPLEAVVWLSYASGDYFAALRESSLPAPWASPMVDPSSLVYDYKGDFLEGPYRLPKILTWTVSEENVRKIQVGSATRTYPVVMLNGLKDYRTGSKGGEFRVVSWTNIQGQAVAMEFELTRNSVPGPGVLERYNGVVHRVGAVTRQAGPPEITGSIGVADYRWQDPRVGLTWINYPITNRLWRGRHDTNLESIFQKKRSNMPLTLPARTPRRNIIRLAVVVTLLGIPLAWMLLSKRGFSPRSRQAIK